MAKMKDSGVEWIGEIPEGWKILRAKNIFRQRNTKGNTVEIHLAATQDNGMYPQHLLDGVVKVKEETNLQEFRTVHKNDFVISFRSFQGGFEKSDYEGVCSPAYQVFYNTSEIDHNYFKKLFKSDGFIAKMNSLTVGIREGKNIQYCDFANSLIPLPPKETQQKIATYLDEKCSQIEQTIQNQQQVIEKLKAYKQSLITEAVTGKVKIQNGKVAGKYEQYKDSGVEWIGEIPSGWMCTKLKFITAKIGDGLHGTPEYSNDGEYYFLNGNNIGKEKLIFKDSTDRLSDEEFNKYKSSVLNENTILIALNGATYGKTSFYNGEKVLLGKSAGYITLNKDTNKKFIRFYLQSSSAKIIEEVSLLGSTIQNLSLETLKNFSISLPSSMEQEIIVDYLDKTCATIDSAIEQKQKLIEKLTEYKKSLIYECVTGKKEI